MFRTMTVQRLTVLSFALASFPGLMYAADDVHSLEALQKRIVRAEYGAEATEAVRAVKRLQNAYGHYAEVGLWNDLADLFAENAVGYYPAGRLEGKPRLRKLFFEEIGLGKLGLDDGRIYPHIVLQPVVTVASDLKSAKGRWRLLSMLGRFGGNATWASGVYENEFVRENGVWKISELRYTGKAGGPYAADGWKEQSKGIPFQFAGAALSAPLPEERTVTLDALKSRMATLTQRVDRLDDEAEVANLHGIYGYYLDRKLWDQMVDLFSAEGTMELAQQGVYAGKASIRRGLNQFGPQGLREGEVNDHVQLQTTVTVSADGSRANVRGVDFVFSRIPGQKAQWTEGIFENEFVKEAGRWKIRSVHFYPRITFDNDKGWAVDAKPAARASAEFPPDRPPTEVYEIYPKFSMIPFHFVHPVTGRPPDYPGGGAFLPASKSSRATSSYASSIRTVRQLEARLSEAERKIERARAHDVAENLMSAFGFATDEHLWDEAANLFAATGWSEVADMGIYQGRDRIRQALASRYGVKKDDSFTIHNITQPVIHASPDGSSAKIRVRTLEFRQTAGRGAWAAGIYEAETVREGAEWQLKSLDGEFTWSARYREDPEAIPAVAGPSSRADRPLRGVSGVPFPKIANLPFHYKNPVTGR